MYHAQTSLKLEESWLEKATIIQGNQVTVKKDIMNIAIIYFMVIGGI